MTDQIHKIDTDILIIGSGIGGLSAALEAAKKNLRALVVSKSAAGEANNTILAGGLFTSEYQRGNLQHDPPFHVSRRFTKNVKVERFVGDVLTPADAKLS